jgi:hypothetical protein
MYFSTSTTGNSQAAKIVALSAKAFGVKLTEQEHAHVPFESVVAAISQAKDLPTDQVASELFRLDPARRRGSLAVGLAKIVEGFGSELQAMQFFRQVAGQRATLRFEGVGGQSHDVMQVRTLLTSHAADAYLHRQNSEHEGLLPVEREYVDLLKSVRRNLEIGVESGKLTPDIAQALAAEFEVAVARVPLPGMRDYVEPLHSITRDELYAENMERVRQRYAARPSPDAGPDLR